MDYRVFIQVESMGEWLTTSSFILSDSDVIEHFLNVKANGCYIVDEEAKKFVESKCANVESFECVVNDTRYYYKPF